MSQFIESIRIEDGRIELLDYHNERFNATRKLFFCVDTDWNLAQTINIPEVFKNGLVKCRIVYDLEIIDVHYSFYNPPKIEYLKLIEAEIDYAFKSTDRMQLEQQKEKAKPADDVLIVKKGLISDTSFSNLIFFKKNRWFTSDSPLLAGVRREYLLNEGLIEEMRISPKELPQFESFMLINAMLDFDESRALPIQNILGL